MFTLANETQQYSHVQQKEGLFFLDFPESPIPYSTDYPGTEVYTHCQHTIQKNHLVGILMDNGLLHEREGGGVHVYV